MNPNSRDQHSSRNPTNITHNVNLSFEIGTSNIFDHDNGQDKHNRIRNGVDDRARNGEGNGKPQGISHGMNHEVRSGYSSNHTHNLGNPSGISPDNDLFDRIQENSPGDEANRQNVKTIGKPKGISHASRLPMLVDPTPVYQIHKYVLETVNVDHIDTNEKMFLLMQESYPSSCDDYEIINKTEKLAISILLTAKVPNLSTEQSIQFDRSLKKINKYRRGESIPEIPHGLRYVKFKVLVPVCGPYRVSVVDITGYDTDLAKYAESLRIMSLELDVINMITTGVIPKMTFDERSQLEQDLLTINAERFVENAPELFLDKSFDDHFVKDAVDVCNNQLFLDYSDHDSLDDDLFSTMNIGSASEDEIITTNQNNLGNNRTVPADNVINLINDEKNISDKPVLSDESKEIW